LGRHLSQTANRRSPPPGPTKYQPIRQVILTDEVGRTLFEEYAAHRESSRGHEETGWVLLGLREVSQAIVLATLPAGTESEAGVAHVQFNSSGQALASRIIRQADRRLTMLGVIHTHPGTLRHPSDGDLRGDREWVRQLRGGEGVFGIGTSDSHSPAGTLYARHPSAHVQTLGALRLSWYALGVEDAAYRPLPYELTLGPDLARPLHSIWATIEAHAERLDRLCRQQVGIRFEVAEGLERNGLVMVIPLAECGWEVRVILDKGKAQYFLLRDGAALAHHVHGPRVDRGVYLLLAEAASRL
jgi:hypothetical protein